MKLCTLLVSAAAMIVAATSAEASNVVVNQTVDLTQAGSFNYRYVNPAYGDTSVFLAPFLVDISVGDFVALNFTFSGDEQVVTQNLRSANVSVWTHGWNDTATVYSTGSLSFFDLQGNVVYSTSVTNDGDCCVHVGQFFVDSALAGAPSTMTFHGMSWTGTVTGYDGYTTRTYADPNLIIGADSLTLIGSPSVPEPASWALMLVGFGLAGSALRRRKTIVGFGQA
jgi:hypothetical protein